MDDDYKYKYRKLLKDINKAIKEGTAMSNEFNRNIEEKLREETGQESNTYTTVRADLIFQ